MINNGSLTQHHKSYRIIIMCTFCRYTFKKIIINIGNAKESDIMFQMYLEDFKIKIHFI